MISKSKADSKNLEVEKMKVFIEIDTGIVFNIDDSTPEGKKEYWKFARDEKYMEWFCFGDPSD